MCSTSRTVTEKEIFVVFFLLTIAEIEKKMFTILIANYFVLL